MANNKQLSLSSKEKRNAAPYTELERKLES